MARNQAGGGPMMALALFAWVAIAAKNYQELRSRQTAAVGRVARVAEVFLALVWPVILVIAGVLAVCGKS